MQVQDGASAGLLGRLERPVAEQRVHVVQVDDGGAEVLHGVRHLLRVVAPAQHGGGGPAGAGVAGVARQQGVRDARALEGGDLQLDGPLLAAGVAVAVVEDEDARRAHRRIPSAGSTRSATTAWIVSARYGRQRD